MTTPWTDYGPAEFDRQRMPKGRKAQPAAQAGLFVLAAEPLPAKSTPLPEELPGQDALFGPDEPCSCGDCRADPYPPEAMRPGRGHWVCCGQHPKGPCCQATTTE